MDQTKDVNPQVETWEEVILIYSSALKEMNTKLEILNEEFKHVHSYNPIEHISSRMKSSESIVKKLKKHDREVNIENMVKYVKDIAGVRVICSFTSDIYEIANMISNQRDLEVLSIKDYVATPKDSGYQSYHMIIAVPVYLSDRIVHAKVELQIRTVAMDFWASLEHKINYKFEGNVPDYIRADLVENAFMIRELDSRMEKLNDEVNSINLS